MTAPRAPQAFVLEKDGDTVEVKPQTKTKAPEIIFESEPVDTNIVTVPHSVPTIRHRFRWGTILIAAVFALVTMYAGLTATRMIESFFATSPWLGWFATAIAATAGIAALAIVARETWGLMSLRRIEHLQLTATHAINLRDRKSADTALAGVLELYRTMPDAGDALGAYDGYRNDIMSADDRLALAERLLIEPRDLAARKIIAKRARKVTLLTTVTPAAALDILFVAAQNLAMLREIATLYGGRPATLSTLRLGRMVLTHLAIAGGLALSDNLLQHLVGKGLLGRLSARFGEGVVNGILTTRIGIAACNLCRPFPRALSQKETITSMAKELLTIGEEKQG
jgi:putative membrane protein